MTRRQFLAGTTLAGVALGLPPWLAGCGSDDDPGPNPTPTPVPGARELRTLHFDFSYGTVRNPRLHALNSQSHGALLTEHDDASRAFHRQRDPALNAVPDEQLTHYIEDVDLPSDALQLVWVDAEDDDSEPIVAAMNVHVPLATLQAQAQRALAQGRDPLASAKALAYGLGDSAGVADPNGAVRAAADYLTPFETAKALVFQNHELMNLNVDLGADILDLIQRLPCTSPDPQCLTYLDPLAELIAVKGPATTMGGWATLVPAMDRNGHLVTDDTGKQAYRSDLDDDVARSVASVAGQIRRAVFDDAKFRGTNWHPTEGITVSRGGVGAPAAGAFAVAAGHPAGASVHGVTFESIAVTDAANRTVELTFRNAYLRYLSAYVQFANEGGDLPVQNPTSADTSRAKFLAWINSNYTVLGIPLIGDAIPLSRLRFNVPAEASQAKVIFGSLGLGGEAFSPEAVNGATLTLIFDIGVPAMLLVAGVAVTGALAQRLAANIASAQVADFVRALIPIATGLAAPGIANGIFGTGNSGNGVAVLTGFGTALLTAGLLYGDFPWFNGLNIAGQVTNFLGPVGVAMKVIAVAADLAAIAQSVGEVLTNPAIFVNPLSLSMTTTVTLRHDPMDFRFPAGARFYDVILTYDSASKVTHRQSGSIEPARVDPIDVVFEGVPSGGMVTVDVYLTTEEGCIVGRSTGADGTAGPFGPVSGTQSAIAITIKEIPIPLTQNTQYVHDLKLEHRNGQHVWVETAAPIATRADLVPGSDDALNDVTAITINQLTGMAGYAFFAGGQGVPYCGQSGSGSMHVFQNVFLAADPDRGLKQLPCGFQQTAGLVYDKLGPAGGRHFFLQPTPAGFLLQSLSLDVGAPIDLDNPLAWGVFSQALDSLAVVPTGYVIGVNRQTHKMQILELPPRAVDRRMAPQAVPFAAVKMGLGTRAGLLNAPVAVTVSGAAILILENGNQRIQAVDASGNPVPLFRNGTTNIVDLEKGSGIVYLDIGVEGIGYIYVLSYVNDGMAPGDYRLDVYTPQGDRLTRTTGVAAARLAVDTFRNVYTLNYETVANAPRIEPSLSQWLPVTPSGCATPTAS